eukprot:3561626-Pleurochrysis_carterae.AAC.1
MHAGRERTSVTVAHSLQGGQTCSLRTPETGGTKPCWETIGTTATRITQIISKRINKKFMEIV